MSSNTSVSFLLRQAASLLLYQNVLNDEVGQAFLALLETIQQNDTSGLACLQAYGRWVRAIASKNLTWQDHLIIRILRDENPFSQQAQRVEHSQLPPSLIAATKHDLEALQSLYQCSSQQLRDWVQIVTKSSPIVWQVESVDLLPLQGEDWGDAVQEVSNYYRQFGTGIFASYRAFRYVSGQLLGIAYPDTIQLQELAGYENQKQLLQKNTEFLLSGYSALHVLLYGSRGSGKSSLIKGLLNQYSTLRVIEVGKGDLGNLPTIVEQLRGVPLKFIIFVDDLSFEEDDDAFKALKVVLEGNLTARPQNVVVYATSNRRHLIREFFDDRPRPRDNEEIHSWDTVQEKLSFSDRFGLTLTFEPANQSTYLEIVQHLAAQAKIPLTDAELQAQALQWATRHNGRSGRTARQFVDFLKADLAV